MVSIVTKKIKGNEYLYLVDSMRKKGKVVQKTIKYIGKKRPIPEEEFECMKYSYSNKDWVLTELKDTLSYTEHEKVKKASNNQKEYLVSLTKTAREKEKEKFLSIFIANSNAIEGSTLTAKQTHDYLFSDIIPPKKEKKELFMANNLLRAWKYMENNVKTMPTKKDIQELHKLVNEGIEDDETLGKYKKIQNYIGDVQTTSYLFVEEKIESLLKWIEKARKKVNSFEIAFQSHAQFEIIHPFIDGNGRVGRLLLNWLLMKKNIEPLAIPVKKRAEYIQALENSRRGKIEAICKFCKDVYLKQYSFV